MQSTRRAHAQWTTDYNNKKLSVVKFLKVYGKKNHQENKKIAARGDDDRSSFRQ